MAPQTQELEAEAAVVETEATEAEPTTVAAEAPVKKPRTRAAATPKPKPAPAVVAPPEKKPRTHAAGLQVDELLALQALDTEIGKLQREQDTLDRGERIERAVALRQARLDTAERRLKGLEIEQRNTELELKALEEKKHQESRRLYEGRITAPRELQALELEIAGLERQRQRLDESILRRMDELEAAKKTVETAKGAVEEAEKALEIIRKRYEKAAGRIQGELKKHEPERDRLAGILKPDVLRRYNDIRRRNHNIAAVRIENGACGGCRMKVGTALLRRMIAQDAYVYCESCTRFLFPPED
jgi:predicted  nucleic acid-binding Zn-ribbon protein